MFFTLTIHKKIIIAVFIIFLIGSLIYIYGSLQPLPSSTDNMVFKVIIDPGHGSIDTGTHYNNIYEKDINLAIAKRLKEEFERVNIIPIMTRTEDKLYQNSRREDIKHRPEVAKNHNADLYISIHVNNFPSSQPKGSQIFCKPGSNHSKSLAEYIQENLIDLRPENDRSIKEGDFYVLNMCPCPAVLIEAGFLSNPEDRKLLSRQDYQKEFARSIREGTVNYLNSQLTQSSIESMVSLPEKKYKNMKIYFLDNTNGKLKLVSDDISYPTGFYLNSNYKELSKKEIWVLHALQQLINPPDYHLSAIPENTVVKNIELINNTLTVNFSSEIKENFNGGAGIEQLTVNQIINTLFSIPGIEKIELLIDGKHNQSIGNHIILHTYSK